MRGWLKMACQAIRQLLDRVFANRTALHRGGDFLPKFLRHVARQFAMLCLNRTPNPAQPHDRNRKDQTDDEPLPVQSVDHYHRLRFQARRSSTTRCEHQCDGVLVRLNSAGKSVLRRNFESDFESQQRSESDPHRLDQLQPPL